MSIFNNLVIESFVLRLATFHSQLSISNMSFWSEYSER